MARFQGLLRDLSEIFWLPLPQIQILCKDLTTAMFRCQVHSCHMLHHQIQVLFIEARNLKLKSAKHPSLTSSITSKNELSKTNHDHYAWSSESLQN